MTYTRGSPGRKHGSARVCDPVCHAIFWWWQSVNTFPIHQLDLQKLGAEQSLPGQAVRTVPSQI